MHRAGDLIEKCFDLRDRGFDPAPFSSLLAVETLGASGGPLTPHRRLLERMNGGYLHDHSLHIFGACEGPPWHSLRAWNAPATWRETYGDLLLSPSLAGLIFFAEDAFGDQFAYNGIGGEVVSFESELGRVVPCAPSFTDWLEEMIERPAAVLPVDVVLAERAQGKHLQPGGQLYAYPPLFTAESREQVSIGHVDAVEAMRFRGELAQKVSGLPAGTRVKIDVGAT